MKMYSSLLFAELLCQLNLLILILVGYSAIVLIIICSLTYMPLRLMTLVYSYPPRFNQ